MNVDWTDFAKRELGNLLVQEFLVVLMKLGLREGPDFLLPDEWGEL